MQPGVLSEHQTDHQTDQREDHQATWQQQTPSPCNRRWQSQRQGSSIKTERINQGNQWLFIIMIFNWPVVLQLVSRRQQSRGRLPCALWRSSSCRVDCRWTPLMSSVKTSRSILLETVSWYDCHISYSSASTYTTPPTWSEYAPGRTSVCSSHALSSHWGYGHDRIEMGCQLLCLGPIKTGTTSPSLISLAAPAIIPLITGMADCSRSHPAWRVRENQQVCVSERH